MANDNKEVKTDDESPLTRSQFLRQQARWVGYTIVLIICLIYFDLLKLSDIHNSSALYIGLPVVMAFGCALVPFGNSVSGKSIKAMVIFLWLSFPILKEGYICVLMAAPLLLSIVGGVGLAVDWIIGTIKTRKNQKRCFAALTAIMAVLALEGTHGALSFERHNEVSYSKVINTDIDLVRQKLSEAPIYCQSRPLFLKLFPVPVQMEGSGLKVGDERHLEFIYYKWFVTNAHKGSTTLKVTKANKNYIRSDVVHDDSYISQYMTWKSSEIFLEDLKDGRTKITWNISYERKLDPAWYFGPMQKYAVYLAAQSFIDNVADPTL